MRRPPPRWAVYVLRCGDGSLYTGATSDLARRVVEHQTGQGARYTRSRLPVSLVYWEGARGRSAAQRREAALKRLRREEKLALLRAARAVRGTARGRSPGAARAIAAATVRPGRPARPGWS
jgi:putative endonuclease